MKHIHPGICALVLALLVAAVGPGPLIAAGGQIEGRVVVAAGEGVNGVMVTSDGFSASAITDQAGQYSLTGIEPGAYTLYLILGDRVAVESDVAVTEGGLTEVVTTVEWALAFAETITVAAVSRQTERIVDAPAAVSILSQQEIERQATHGQAPRLLRSAPGAELAQSGLYDFNFNVRGFNGTTNRRVLTLIDGRDPSQPVFSGAQEWAAVSFALEELESVELVYGPSASLYGAEAFNGVLDMRTRSPRDSQGGRAQLTVGELDTVRVDLRHAGRIGQRNFYKVGGLVQESDDFTQSRVDSVEYEPGLLPTEAIPPPLDKVSLGAGSFRFDSGLSPRLDLSAEVGTARIEGPTTVTGLGRIQRTDVDRPWARFSLGTTRWNLLGYYTGRDSDGEVALSSGQELYLDSGRYGLEVQGNMGFGTGKGRLVGGVSLRRERTDSANPEGMQTLFAQVVRADRGAVYGQVDYDLMDRLKAVVSLRWDESDVFDGRLSPRGALVWGIAHNHTLRLTAGQGFLSPALSEKFVQVQVAPPLDLSGIEEPLAPILDGVSLGLDTVPLLAVGNEALDVETISSFELGYNAILGRSAFLTINLFRNELEDFTSNLIPVLGTSLGQLQEFPAYRPPDELSAAAQAIVLATLDAALPPNFLLAQTPDGMPFIPLLSFGEFGKVDSQGVEIGLNVKLDRWLLDFGYSYFDFEVKSEAPEIPLSPNRADNQLSAGFSYLAPRWDAGLKGRWSDGFPFLSGIFVGPVEAYTVLDTFFNVLITDRFRVGIDVANVLDSDHWEFFGGDLLGRRALVRVDFSW